jgi:hypothetical protein
MCYIIDSKYVLANYLMGRPKITIAELKNLANEIESKVPTVFVDISRDSLGTTMDYFSMMFRQDDATICRANEKYFTLDNINLFFNNDIPEKIRSSFLACFK